MSARRNHIATEIRDASRALDELAAQLANLSAERREQARAVVREADEALSQGALLDAATLAKISQLRRVAEGS